MLAFTFVVSTIQSHITQRKFVWKSTEPFRDELLKFFANTVVIYLLNALLLEFFFKILGFTPGFTQIPITMTLACFSYFSQKKFIFKAV